MALDALDVESLRELQRLLRDLDHEKQAAVNRARVMPCGRRTRSCGWGFSRRARCAMFGRGVGALSLEV